MTLSACNISKKCAVALVWIGAVQDLDSRFQEIIEAVVQAKTPEEKHQLFSLAWGLVQQAEQQLAQLKSKIQRMKEVHFDSLHK